MNKGNVKADPKERNFHVWKQCFMVLLLVWPTMSWVLNGVIAMDCEGSHTLFWLWSVSEEQGLQS